MTNEDVLRERVATLEKRLAGWRSPPHPSASTTKEVVLQDSDDLPLPSRHRRLPPDLSHLPCSQSLPSSELPSHLSHSTPSASLSLRHPPPPPPPALKPRIPLPPTHSSPLPGPFHRSSPTPPLPPHISRSPWGPTEPSPSSLLEELESVKRCSMDLEERAKNAEHEAALLRADKACVMQALDYTRKDNNALHLVGEEAEKVVELVRCENSELLEMVEEQHSLLAQQQARASSAEREVHRLHDEVNIMKAALHAGDERTEALHQRAEAAERLLATFLRMVQSGSNGTLTIPANFSLWVGNPNLGVVEGVGVGGGGGGGYHSHSQNGFGGNGTLQTEATYASLPPSALPSHLPSPFPALPSSLPPLNSPSLPPPSMAGNPESSMGTPPPPALKAIGRVVGAGILSEDEGGGSSMGGEKSPQGLSGKQQKLLQQQQQLLLALLQKGKSEREERREWKTWVIYGASLAATAAAAAVVTSLVMSHRRQR